MKSGYNSPRLAKVLSASTISLVALLSAQTAWANCTTTAGTVVCDSSSPNPYVGFVGGNSITLNSGAQVQGGDPYAGAAVVYGGNVALYNGGTLNAQNGSTISEAYAGFGGVAAGANSTANLNGAVTVQGTNSFGVSAGQGATINVGGTGVINASGSGSTGILVTGNGAIINIDGTVRNASNFGASTIKLISSDQFNPVINNTATINVNATGQVLSTGAASPAVILTSGSTLNVAGLVRAYTSSNAIDYRGTTGGTATVNILAGGTVQTTGTTAIIGSDGAMNLTVAGTVNAGGAANAIQLGSANDVVTLVTGSVVNGVIDGGGGFNALVLTGTGAGTVNGTTNFGNVAISSGTWTLASPLSGSNGITIAPGATGIGTASRWGNLIYDGGTLVFDQSANETYVGNLTGPGQLVKTGTGTLTLGNQNNFSGATLVSAGQLVMTGSMPSIVTVGSGGTLAGTGRISGLVVQSGGIVAPGTGNAGTLTVAGNYAQASGSTYVAQVVGSTADTIVVTGTASLASGSRLVIATQNPVLGRSYTLLTATGGVTGQYTVVQSDIGYRLTYSGNSVVLDLGRSNAALLGLAQGANQMGMVSAVLGLPANNTLYTALALATDDASVRAAYPQLTGDLHGAVRASILRNAELMAGAALARTGAAQPGLHLWGQILGSTGNSTGVDGAARVSRQSYGGVLGLEDGLGPVTLGLAAGYVHARLNAATGRASVNTPQILGYARVNVRRLSVQGGVGYAWASNDVSRQVAFTGFADADHARYKGDVLHGFAEIGVPVPVGGGAVTPFLAGRVYRLATNGFVEQGGAAALQGAGRTRWSEMTEVGARLSTPVVGALSAQSRLSWQHRYGAEQAMTRLGFAAGGPDFAVRGADLSRDAAAFDLGLGWKGGKGIAIDLGYHGVLGNRGVDHVGQLALSLPL